MGRFEHYHAVFRGREQTHNEPHDQSTLHPEERDVDQIHWSLDGRLIYCVAKREASAFLLAVPVDPQYARPSGAPREVVSLDQFAVLPEDISAIRFCVAPGHLVVQKIERTGNIWRGSDPHNSQSANCEL